MSQEVFPSGIIKCWKCGERGNAEFKTDTKLGVTYKVKNGVPLFRVTPKQKNENPKHRKFKFERNDDYICANCRTGTAVDMPPVRGKSIVAMALPAKKLKCDNPGCYRKGYERQGSKVLCRQHYSDFLSFLFRSKKQKGADIKVHSA